MINAFVLISTVPGKESEVLEGLQQHSEVAEAKVVYGDYDVVVKLSADSMDSLNNFMLGRFNQVSGIRHTTTLIAL